MATTIKTIGMDSAPAIEGERPLSGSVLTARVDRRLGVVMITRAGQVRFLAAPSLAEISSPARGLDLLPRLARCQPGIF